MPTGRRSELLDRGHLRDAAQPDGDQITYNRVINSRSSFVVAFFNAPKFYDCIGTQIRNQESSVCQPAAQTKQCSHIEASQIIVTENVFVFISRHKHDVIERLST